MHAALSSVGAKSQIAQDGAAWGRKPSNFNQRGWLSCGQLLSSLHILIKNSSFNSQHLLESTRSMVYNLVERWPLYDDDDRQPPLQTR